MGKMTKDEIIAKLRKRLEMILYEITTPGITIDLGLMETYIKRDLEETNVQLD